MGVPDAQFIDDAVEAVEGLIRRMQRETPAKISIDIFRGRLNHAINRRRYWPYPTFGRTYGFNLRSVVLSPNPAGPKDEDATVVVLRETCDGKPLAALCQGHHSVYRSGSHRSCLSRGRLNRGIEFLAKILLDWPITRTPSASRSP
jgi:hypothetical protein